MDANEPFFSGINTPSCSLFTSDGAILNSAEYCLLIPSIWKHANWKHRIFSNRTNGAHKTLSTLATSLMHGCQLLISFKWSNKIRCTGKQVLPQENLYVMYWYVFCLVNSTRKKSGCVVFISTDLAQLFRQIALDNKTIQDRTIIQQLDFFMWTPVTFKSQKWRHIKLNQICVWKKW